MFVWLEEQALNLITKLRWKNVHVQRTMAKPLNEISSKIALDAEGTTTKLSQTENVELKNEIAKLKRAKSPEYSTPLPNKSCSNGENAQIKDSSTRHEADQSMTSTDLDQDLSLVNQDASTGSEKTINLSL
ncbi:18816_t:CDS:2, partial [Acaulospora morrowiae]